MPLSDCAQYCSKFPSPELVGFGVETVFGAIFCSCLYSGPNLPTPPAGEEVTVDSTHTGAGPIVGTKAEFSNSCYAFAQVREVFIFLYLAQLNPHSH